MIDFAITLLLTQIKHALLPWLCRFNAWLKWLVCVQCVLSWFLCAGRLKKEILNNAAAVHGAPSMRLHVPCVQYLFHAAASKTCVW